MGGEADALLQFVKYAIAGGVATAVHIVTFHLFAWKLLPALQENDLAVTVLKLPVAELDDATRSRNSMIDNLGAFVLANAVAYVINIFWVFERGRHGWLLEIGLFYAVSGTSVLIGTVLMGFLIKRYGMRTTYAFAANIVSAVLINYAARKFFIFKS